MIIRRLGWSIWLGLLAHGGTLYVAVAGAGSADVQGSRRTAEQTEKFTDVSKGGSRGQPNVLLILLDDVGFASTSTFGGPVQTPNLEQLASTGLRYNNFHTQALCAPTRAALLTGRNSHRVGFGTLPEATASGDLMFPGYDTTLRRNAALIPAVLRRNGYRTAAFGKWHLTPYREWTPAGPFDHYPTHLGFDYFYGFIQSDTNEWEPALTRNTAPVEPSRSPAQRYHLTRDLVDDAIAWLKNAPNKSAVKPYFLYFAPYATHSPHQVPEEWIRRYRGRFDGGWDQLREEIFTRQKKLGVIPATAQLTVRPDTVPPWGSLTADQRRLYARQMEVYAGFLAHTDHEIGRLLKAVQKEAKGDNTLVLYIVGDNGATGEGGLSGTDFLYTLHSPSLNEQLTRADRLGEQPYQNVFSVGWAWVLSTPFPGWKGMASHLGGIRNPMVVSWPAKIKTHGEIRSQFSHVNDIAATVFEAAGVRPPRRFDGVDQLPLDGVSLLSTFFEPRAHSNHRTQYFEVNGSRSIISDGWMAAAKPVFPPGTEAKAHDYSRDKWTLYDLSKDFSQSHDVASVHPQKLQQIQHLFEVEALRNNVLPLGAVFMRSGIAVSRQSVFTYDASFKRTPATHAPDFLRSHRIQASVVIPEGGAEGVLFSKGSRIGGFTLYVKQGRLTYESLVPGHAREILVSTSSVPSGQVDLSFEFTQERVIAEYSGKAMEVSGRGRLFINGQPAGELALSHVGGFRFDFGTMNIGKSSASPVSPAYEAPFVFNGSLKQVKVELR